MAELVYKGSVLPARGGESVLDCLTRNDMPVRSSCRAGVCQSCLVQGASTPPPSSQKGLAPSLVSRNFFLACQCAVEDSPEISSDDELPTYPSRVLSIEELCPDIYRVFIERPPDWEFVGGQFVHLTRPSDGLTRSYSIASRATDEHLELHVARLRDGAMSHYLTREAGTPLQLRGPAGSCVYSGDRQESLLLVGTGTGLAPLLGVLRAALAHEHSGPIHLIHGATKPSRLYLSQELRQLEALRDCFHYAEDVLVPGAGTRSARAGLAALIEDRFPNLEGYRVYLCGDPHLVNALKKQCFLAGAALRAIHADPFVLSPGN